MDINTKRAVFLDLNGTLVMPIKVNFLSELKLIPGVDQAVARLTNAGFQCPVVTVQSRIAKGLFSESEFRTWFKDFFDCLELNLKGPYICPHRFSEPCECKKPKSMLYEQAASDLSIDLRRSYVVGDSASDVIAAKNIGGLGCFVKTGWGKKKSELEAARLHADFVGNSLGEITDWILSKDGPKP